MKFVFIETSLTDKVLLHVYIDCCHNLKSLDQSSIIPSSKVELQVGQSDNQSTSVKPDDSNPVFQKEFTFLVDNPYVDDLNINVIEHLVYASEFFVRDHATCSTHRFAMMTRRHLQAAHQSALLYLLGRHCGYTEIVTGEEGL